MLAITDRFRVYHPILFPYFGKNEVEELVFFKLVFEFSAEESREGFNVNEEPFM
jgi:hypothetical protein